MSWNAPPIRRESHAGRVIACFRDRPRHLNDLLAHTVSLHAAREALVDGDRRFTYGELDALAASVAAGLAAAGIVAGDRVVLLAGNRAEFFTALLGVFRLGAIAVPVNTREEREGVRFVVEQCTARAIVFDADLADRVPLPPDASSLLARYSVGGHVAGSEPFEPLERTPASAAPGADPAEDDTAVLLYTSGTTGRPKGAMLTHLNIIHSVMHFELCMGNTHEDRSLLAVPASHVTGLVAITLAMFRVGGCVVLLREFKAGVFLALAERERVTHTLVVPAIYNLLLREPRFATADLSRWRAGGYGGAPMPQATIAALAERLPNLVLQNAYGATETTSPATVVPAGEQAAHLDSVGRVVPCGDVRVMDDDGREVPAGTTGELWIGGPMVVPGYWDNEAATAREFVGGYWKSGDLGSIDADGYVRILDRKKDLINRGGYKVFSAEVESALAAHPAVLESALIAEPDPVLGEKSRAIVVLREQGCSAEDLRAHCRSRLADYKVPDFVTFRAEPLPRNANGKVLKRLLRSSG